ncbi:hypothetical protein [Cylindrospermum sp. FACHB-282]|uniref:hypothetical protein n=1 Tax=Cylindrospermum sp. FACHB-282 TaxID=2692794 RepID=UPI00168A2719|nr:hypothetical protein [Cylindrospermum sp. FACHB-282]MBD2387761.1 hypothetical protein [Cylindrospermum sp. FACHB-282]
MSQEAIIDDVQEPITSAPPEVRQIIEKVWRVEKRRLDRKLKSPIIDEILDIVKEAVQ